MNSVAVNLTCREWGYLPIGENGLLEAKAKRLHALAELAAHRLKLPETAVLTRTHRSLRAGQVIGILATSGMTLEILPKIDGNKGEVRRALIRMLAVTRELPIADGELAALDTQRHDLLELLIKLFADRLFAAVRRGLHRHYCVHEEDLALLRGRLNVKRQFTHLVVRRDRLACRFDELSEDTPLNRVFKAAVIRLAGIARSAENTQRLAELAARFEFVSDIPDSLRERVQLDRTNTAFHDLYRLARLFLAGDWQSTTRGRAEGFTLLFAMNSLFEEFIGQSLKRALATRSVHLQPREHCAVTSVDGRFFYLRPDAVIKEPTLIILDTKWKRLTREEKTLGVAQADIYQMLAYAQAYDAGRLILLYPWHKEMGGPGIISRDWKVTGTSRQLDIATIDVGQPEQVAETLRHIVR